jgi:hypothetical protein
MQINENADHLPAAGAETGHADDQSCVSDAAKVTRPRHDGKPPLWRSDIVAVCHHAGPSGEVAAAVADIGNDTCSTSPEAIRFGLALPEPFSAAEIRAVLPGPEQRAHWWLSGWERKGWAEKTGDRGKYRRTSTFGQ